MTRKATRFNPTENTHAVYTHKCSDGIHIHPLPEPVCKYDLVQDHLKKILYKLSENVLKVLKVEVLQ